MAEAPRLLGRVRDKNCLKRYSIRNEETYVQWIRGYMLYESKVPCSAFLPEHLKPHDTAGWGPGVTICDSHEEPPAPIPPCAP
jgi:hypothetical protein